MPLLSQAGGPCVDGLRYWCYTLFPRNNASCITCKLTTPVSLSFTVLSVSLLQEDLGSRVGLSPQRKQERK